MFQHNKFWILFLKFLWVINVEWLNVTIIVKVSNNTIIVIIMEVKNCKIAKNNWDLLEMQKRKLAKILFLLQQNVWNLIQKPFFSSKIWPFFPKNNVIGKLHFKIHYIHLNYTLRKASLIYYLLSKKNISIVNCISIIVLPLIFFLNFSWICLWNF